MGLIDRLVEREWPGVYFNPARWPTADGYIPFPVFALYAAALHPALALDRLNLAQGFGITQAEKSAAERTWEATVREAYPVEA